MDLVFHCTRYIVSSGVSARLLNIESNGENDKEERNLTRTYIVIRAPNRAWETIIDITESSFARTYIMNE